MASTYFIRYATSNRGNHADSRGRFSPQVGKPVSPEAQTRTSKMDPYKLPGRARFQSGQHPKECKGFAASSGPTRYARVCSSEPPKPAFWSGDFSLEPEGVDRVGKNVDLLGSSVNKPDRAQSEGEVGLDETLEWRSTACVPICWEWVGYQPT